MSPFTFIASRIPGFLKGRKVAFILLSVFLLSISSCSETDATWNPYYNWQARNASWFSQVADTARTAIAQAKALYGDKWEEKCEWRMFKSFRKSAVSPGVLADSICVRILTRGQGLVSPCYTDSVRVNFRGWTMETEYLNDAGKLESSMSVFAQTYYGTFDPQTAAPQLMSVKNTIDGYSTALQYMVTGDDWLVYIPQELAYGSKDSNSIPAYSMLLYRLNMVGVCIGGKWQ